MVAHTDVNGLPQQEALLESFSPVSQDATKAHDWATGLTWTLLLHNLHSKLLLIAVSHIPVIAPHTWLLNMSLSVHSSASCLTHALGQEHLYSFCLSKTSYGRVGTGESGKSYSIPPQFATEDAIAHMWYFNIGKCWKCIPKIWKLVISHQLKISC